MTDAATKYECARREVAYRRAVYGGLVRRGLMTQREATRQIALMEEIANDYRRQIEPDMLERRLERPAQ